jgi:ABC-type Fe2+-enterobactin transport system substrate-binding protein
MRVGAWDNVTLPFAPATVRGQPFCAVAAKLIQAPTRIVSTSVTLTGSLLAIDAPVIASGATAPNRWRSPAHLSPEANRSG